MTKYLALLIVLAAGAAAQGVSTNRVILGDPPGGAGAACTAPATNIYLASTGLEYTCFMSTWSSVGSAGSGTVTSVAASFTGGLVSVGGSPVTTAGTLAFTVAGTSGGVPYFSGAATWASSAALTANLPMIGGGAGNPPSVGTRSGNTTAFVTTTGTQTSGDCVKIDANGNHIANGSACGGGSGSVTSISTTSPIGGGTITTTGTITCTTCTTNASALTANLPVIGGGGNATAVGTRSGNTTSFATTSGSLTSGNCAKFDASGNIVDNGGACGSGGTGTVTVVGSGNLTSTALVTGGGSQALQTPAATATMDSSGNISTPGSLSTGVGGAAAGAINLGQGTACTPSANYICEYAPASVTAYGVVKAGTVGVTGIVHNTVSGTVRTEVAPSLIVNADITNATIDLASKVTNALPTANMAAAALIRTCIIAVGDPGAASPVLANDNDSPEMCKNKTGATMTITSVACFADAGSPTVTPIITGGGGTSILSGALTCDQSAGGAAGSLNGTPTLTSNTTIDGNITSAGGTAKYLVITIGMTL